MRGKGSSVSLSMSLTVIFVRNFCVCIAKHTVIALFIAMDKMFYMKQISDQDLCISIV